MAVLPKLVGEPVKRREDPRLITGSGTYVDNLKLPNMCYAAFLRSPYAHARIISIDASAAQQMPGVLLVWTAADVVGVPALPADVLPGMKSVQRPLLATGKVRHVGDPVAVVVATDRYTARDALDAIAVEYDELPVVMDVEKAAEPAAPKLFDELSDNVVFHHTFAHGDVAAAFAQADVVIKQRIVNQRLIPLPMEPRAAVAEYRAATKEITLWASTQNPHTVRTRIAQILRLPEHAVRIIAPDVGGGFGAKVNIFLEDCLVALLSAQLGLPVKWTEDRRENFVATTHGRDQVDYVEVAAKRDGTVTGLKVKVFADLGGYLQIYTAQIPTLTYAMINGCYHLTNIEFELIEAFTNKTPTDAYRGAGRPEAAYIIERVMDLVAAELKLDPADVRRKNFIPPSAFPYATPPGQLYDSGEYAATLAHAQARVDYAALRQMQADARKAGRIVGIGMSTYVEICGFGPFESAIVRADPSGKVTVYTGTSPHGQGIVTAFAQLVADELGIPMDDITVLHSDTAMAPYGFGTSGSRSMAVGGPAVIGATHRVREKAKLIASHLLEAAAGDIEFANGHASVRGVPSKQVSFAAICKEAYGPTKLPRDVEPGLEATYFFNQPATTFPFGTHIVAVEIDKETGQTQILRYLAVDDCGRIINPMLVAGQVHGGLAQGVGQALWEGVVYNESGQLVTASLMDYAVPRASMVPSWELDHTVTPTAVNPLGAKGVGEAGTIGSTPAVVSAVCDALAPFGIRHLDMPLTPEKVWRAMQKA